MAARRRLDPAGSSRLGGLRGRLGFGRRPGGGALLSGSPLHVRRFEGLARVDHRAEVALCRQKRTRENAAHLKLSGRAYRRP